MTGKTAFKQIACRRLLAGMTAAVLLLLLWPVLTPPAQAAGEVVRVGYYESDNFQECYDHNKEKRGYSYEYLQKLAYHTGWYYEYEYGGWAELYDKLLKGEIDVLAGVSRTEERSGQMLFPDEIMGVEQYYLYVHPEDSTLSASDLTTFNGVKIGVIKNNLLATYAEAWAAKNGIQPEFVYYDSFQDSERDFYAGKLDVVTATDNSVPSEKEMKPLLCTGKGDYYLAVANGRQDLLQQLNTAQEQMLEDDPYFRDSLQDLYFGENATNYMLSAAEEDWLSAHQTLRIGYLESYLPFSARQEDGDVTGILTNIAGECLDKLSLRGELSIQYVPYTSCQAMLGGLHGGEVDTIFPMPDSIWNSEQNSVNQSQGAVDVAVSLVFKGEFSSDKIERIAVAKGNPIQKVYAETSYPDSEITIFETERECLRAVLNDKADCTLFSSFRADYYLQMAAYSTLRELPVEAGISCCFCVNKGDTALLSILNKGLSHIDQAALTNNMFNYVNIQEEATLSEVLSEHFSLVLLGIAIIFLVILLSLLLYLRAIRRKSEEISALNGELEKAKQEADAANSAKTAFLFNMSHDIRTPMNAIIGFTNMAVKHIDDRERVLDSLHKTQEAGNLLLSLINNILDMSRIESGAAKLEENPGDVYLAFANIEGTMQELAKARNIALSFEVANITDRYVYVDFSRCARIFVNIIGNAIKYTGEGGFVKVRCEQIGRENDRGIYRYTFRDNGIGMSEEFQKRVFDEFSREETSTVSGIQGTGLGLSVCKTFVSAMNGTIECKSKKGEGSTFLVTLPLRLQEKQSYTDPTSGEVLEIGAERTEEKPPELIDLRGRRILLVEDNELNMEIGVDILSEEGMQVETAEDGSVAVKLLEEKGPEAYDCILMDIQMPIMNGHEATRAIRRLYPDAKLPIIALSANAFAEDKAASLEAGMNDHIAKPIYVEDLKAALAKYLA